MPTVTLRRAGLFPVGTEIRAYRRGDWRLPGFRPKRTGTEPRMRAPSSIERAPVIATAVMELDNLGRNAATFTLEEGHYVFAAEVDGEWRHCHGTAIRKGADSLRVSDPRLA